MGTIADMGNITLESISKPEADDFLNRGEITREEYENFIMAKKEQEAAKIAFIKQLSELKLDRDYSEATVRLR